MNLLHPGRAVVSRLCVAVLAVGCAGVDQAPAPAASGQAPMPPAVTGNAPDAASPSAISATSTTSVDAAPALMTPAPDAAVIASDGARGVDAGTAGDRSSDVPPSNHCGAGANKVTETGALIPLGKTTKPLRFGTDQSGKNGFPGSIDRVRLYGRALTGAEVAAHAQRQYEPCTMDGNCVGEWTFESMDNGVFPSTGGSPELAARLGAKINGNVTLVDAPEGKGVHFDGTGFVEIPHDPALAFARSFSYEVWVKRDELCPPSLAGCTLMRLIDKSSTFTIDLHAGSFRVILAAGAFHGHPWPTVNKWAHGVVTVDEQVVRWYLNGKLVESCFADNRNEK